MPLGMRRGELKNMKRGRYPFNGIETENSHSSYPMCYMLMHDWLKAFSLNTLQNGHVAILRYRLGPFKASAVRSECK